jgi:predicted ATPase
MNGKCDRCSKPSTVTTGSYFNQEMICMECEKRERNHPEYKEAKQRELEEVRKGNMNYGGIGKPNDL